MQHDAEEKDQSGGVFIYCLGLQTLQAIFVLKEIE